MTPSQLLGLCLLVAIARPALRVARWALLAVGIAVAVVLTVAVEGWP